MSAYNWIWHSLVMLLRSRHQRNMRALESLVTIWHQLWVSADYPLSMLFLAPQQRLADCTNSCSGHPCIENKSCNVVFDLSWSSLISCKGEDFFSESFFGIHLSSWFNSSLASVFSDFVEGVAPSPNACYIQANLAPVSGLMYALRRSSWKNYQGELSFRS